MKSNQNEIVNLVQPRYDDTVNVQGTYYEPTKTGQKQEKLENQELKLCPLDNQRYFESLRFNFNHLYKVTP